MADSPKKPGKAFFLSDAFRRKLERLAAQPETVLDPAIFSFSDRGGKRFWTLKKPDAKSTGKGDEKRGRFRCWVDPARHRLMVDPGTILYPGGNGLSTPVFPELDGTPLDVIDANGWGQGFSLSGKSAGTLYTVVLFFRIEKCGTSIPDEEEEEEDPDINTIQMLSPGEVDGIDWDNENKGGVIVAEVRLKSGDYGLEEDSIVQYLGSDYTPACVGDDGDSPVSSEDEESSDSSDEDSNNGSGSDDDDDDSSGDPPDPCCPGILDLVPVSDMDGGCFYNEYTPETVTVTVGGLVGPIPQTDDCKKCNYRFRVEYGIGSNRASEQIGYGNHRFGSEFVITAYACQVWTVWANVYRFGVPTDSNGCAELMNCRREVQMKMPPVCGETCDESSSDIVTSIIPDE